MPAAARDGDDVTLGHVCQSMTMTDGGSLNVFIEGIGAHRQTADTVLFHLDDSDAPICAATHAPTLVTASPNVYVNGEPLGRVTDSYGCGYISSGAETVFVNDPLAIIETAFPKETSLITAKDQILEMIATLVLGKQVQAEPLHHLSEKEIIDIFVNRDSKAYVNKEHLENVIYKEVSPKLSQTAEDLHVFRGGQGYLAKNKLLSHDDFMMIFGKELRKYATLKRELFELKARVQVEVAAIDSVTGEQYTKITKKNDLALLKQVDDLSERVHIIEDLLVDNASHDEIAKQLWKESSVVIDRPMIIKRTHKLYDDLYKDSRDKPITAHKTYSATLIDIDDLPNDLSPKASTTIGGAPSRIPQYYIVPAGTRVITTVGLADGHEILIRGETLMNPKLLYSGSILQEVNLNLQKNNFSHIDDDLYDQAVKEFKKHNPDMPIPKLLLDLKADIAAAIPGAPAEGNLLNSRWRLNILMFALTGGLHAVLGDDEKYWDIYNSKSFSDYQLKLTAYYGHSTYEMITPAQGTQSQEDYLNQLALATAVQLFDVGLTAIPATGGWAIRSLWKQQDKVWYWLMNHLHEFEKELEELLTPPDGWENY